MQKKKSHLLPALQIISIILFSAAIFAYAGDIANLLGRFSYFGIFAISLISAASVFFPTAPLQLAIFSVGSVLNPLLVGIVAGVGSCIGELTGYALGHHSQKLLKRRDRFSRYIIKVQKDILHKQAGIAVFLLSFLPNPFFDFAGIAAGIMKMPWWHFLIWAGAGRILRYASIAYFGNWLNGNYLF